MCKTVSLFFRTNRHRPDLPQYAAHDSRSLPAPTQDTRVIIDAALQLLDQLFKPGFMYKKLGVILSDFVPSNAVQLDLFNADNDRKSRNLMQALDDINRKFGAETVHSALTTSQKENNEEEDD
jgi:DNA polymerase V